MKKVRKYDRKKLHMGEKALLLPSGGGCGYQCLSKWDSEAGGIKIKVESYDEKWLGYHFQADVKYQTVFDDPLLLGKCSMMCQLAFGCLEQIDL